MNIHLTPQPSELLYAKVRSGFVKKGTSLAAWCRENGVHRQNARDALIGVWKGTKAKRLMVRVLTAAECHD